MQKSPLANYLQMGVTMGNLIRKFVLGTASVLVLGIGGTALDYAVDPANAVADAGSPATVATTPIVSHIPEGRDFIRKDDIRWAQLNLRYRGLYKGSLDGVLGPETRSALARFQKRAGLSQTASLDAQTWETLTGNSEIGQGSSIPSNSDNSGTVPDSSAASHFGN